MKAIFIILILQFCNVFAYLDVKPDFLKTCTFGSTKEEFSKCHVESIQGLFTNLATGIKGLQRPEPIEPMKISNITFVQGNGPVYFNSSLTNITITGFKDIQVLDSMIDSKDFTITTKLRVPTIRIDAGYNVGGRVFLVPVNGHGDLWFEPSNLDVSLVAKTTLYELGEHVFYNITDVTIDYKVKDLKFRLNNLLAFEDFTNRYLNDRWMRIEPYMHPLISKTISTFVMRLMTEIFNGVPAEYLVADIPRPSKLRQEAMMLEMELEANKIQPLSNDSVLIEYINKESMEKSEPITADNLDIDSALLEAIKMDEIMMKAKAANIDITRK